MRTLVIFTSGSTEAKKKITTPDLRLLCTCRFSDILLQLSGGGGGGVSNKFSYGEAPPQGPTPYPFKRKRYPFRIPSIDKWYPFHIPCLELCIPFYCCKCIVVFKNRNQSQK